jgi:predicted metalloprotease with PDZ domain
MPASRYLAALSLLPAAISAQSPRQAPPLVSAPVSNVAYDVTFDAKTAATRTIGVRMSFDVAGPAPVVLSLPAWTPGSYTIANFARWVSAFGAAGDGKALDWDKTDYDTWRILPGSAKHLAVSFTYLADSMDNGMAWARDDVAFFNGTNLFLYAEGRGFDAPATVTIHTEAAWMIATGMTPASSGAANAYGESNYHDLVDMPFLIGKIDLDSMRVSDRWIRFATYPAGAVSGVARRTMWDWIAKSIPPEVAVFGEAPWSSYTVLQVADSTFGGWSGLEHQNSHLDIVGWFAIDDLSPNSFTSDLYAHEIFHSWNVKRLRPAEMVPYRYDRAQPTTLLWVSEGVTDYYADLALVRGGVIDVDGFLGKVQEHLMNVGAAPPTALDDASLSTWIEPTDGTKDLYYAKGALAGLMLDILIRDATDNRRSLDDVMRDLYLTTWKKGQGFSTDQWWSAVSRAAGGRSFADFAARYVHGRDPYPIDSLLRMAGMMIRERRPLLGVRSNPDSAGERIMSVDAGGPADRAGVKVGDRLMSLGGIPVVDEWRAKFWAKFTGAAGAPLSIVVERDGRRLTLETTVQLAAPVPALDPAASPRALRIREGLLKGTVAK